ncbi:hypothetical protein DSCW_05170 [Desulfosarcina widdelii]|uniref:ISXO2-like transposase domain-containing protein n=2 Tax=Desulfosarcina widdelii TaxID=947919 RepID=A0A5K7YXM6_9BACT|nr:hypothetical protein DSCW_05170 [Desulfosarcina widdelii]
MHSIYSIVHLSAIIDRFNDKRAYMKTDKMHAYKRIDKQYLSYLLVNHLRKEYSRDDIHRITSELFNAILKRDRKGVFCYLSKKHLPCYRYEIISTWTSYNRC